MGPTHIWQRYTSIAVGVVAAAILATCIARARWQLQQPVTGFSRFHREIARSAAELLHRQLTQQDAETVSLAGLANFASAAGAMGTTDRARMIVRELGSTRCSRGAAIIGADGRVVAVTDSVNGAPSAIQSLPPAGRRATLVVSPLASDRHLTFMSQAPLAATGSRLVCATLADAAVGTSMPGYSETLSTDRAYLVRAEQSTVIVIGAAGTTTAAQVIARLPVGDAGPALRIALAGHEWEGEILGLTRTRVRAQVNPFGSDGWVMLQTQEVAEIMRAARRAATVLVSLGALLAGSLVGAWIVIL